MRKVEGGPIVLVLLETPPILYSVNQVGMLECERCVLKLIIVCSKEVNIVYHGGQEFTVRSACEDAAEDRAYVLKPLNFLKFVINKLFPDVCSIMSWSPLG